MNRMLLAIMLAASLSAPALAGACADLGRGMRFCDPAGGAKGQATTPQSGSATTSQGQATTNQSGAGSSQKGR